VSEPKPIPYDICATDEANGEALLDALLTGRPLAMFDSTKPEIPPFLLGMELSRVTDDQPPSSG
jgi:hypothetical protein